MRFRFRGGLGGLGLQFTPNIGLCGILRDVSRHLGAEVRQMPGEATKFQAVDKRQPRFAVKGAVDEPGNRSTL